MTSTCGIFKLRVQAELVTNADSMMLGLRTTSLEGLLIKLYSTSLTKEVWKSKTHGLKKKATGPLAWKMVHASLQARAEKAIRLIA